MGQWRETLALLCTYTERDHFRVLVDQLATRLSQVSEGLKLDSHRSFLTSQHDGLLTRLATVVKGGSEHKSVLSRVTWGKVMLSSSVTKYISG